MSSRLSIVVDVVYNSNMSHASGMCIPVHTSIISTNCKGNVGLSLIELAFLVMLYKK